MTVVKKITVFLILFSLCICYSSSFAYANEESISNISAKSACLIDAESGRVLYSKNSNQRLPMASTTKIMTAIIALESGIELNMQIKVPIEAVGIEGSSAYLKYGETVTFELLLYALMLSSANDAAIAIAYTVCGSIEQFVDLMNQKAHNLGLTNTHFTNPHGLYHEDHYTTAEELAKIMAYAMKNANFAQITSCHKKAFEREDGSSFLFTNHNKLLNFYDGTIGGKTGFTKKSGRCLVSCAERDGLRLIIVSLSAPNDWNDHAKLYDFAFACYESICFKGKEFEIPVVSGVKNEVKVYSHDFALTLPKKHNDITIQIHAPRFLFATVRKDEKIGEIVYLQNGKAIATLPLYACEDVAQIKYKFNLFDWLKDLFKGIFN